MFITLSLIALKTAMARICSAIKDIVADGTKLIITVDNGVTRRR